MSGTPIVLLVDDSQSDVKLMLRAMGELRPRHEIRVIRDGVEALEYMLGTGHAVERAPAQSPRLILLDLKLPRIGGGVLRKVKSSPRTRSTPVVILTSSDRNRIFVRATSLVQTVMCRNQLILMCFVG